MTIFYKPNKAVYKAVIFTGTPLVHPKPEYNGRMFQGLAITEDGSRLIVGGHGGYSYDGSGFPGAWGRAYSMIKSSGNWIVEQELIPSFSPNAINYGYACAVSADGTYCAVSAATGYKVAVFKRTGSSWTETCVVEGLSTDTGFGSSIAMSDDGSTLIVGAYQAYGTNYTVSAQGGVYVYYLNNGIWSGAAGTYSALLKQNSNDVQSSSMFGLYVDIAGDGSRCIIGAHNRSYSTYYGNGAVYIFKKNGDNSWSLEHKFIPTILENSSTFGNTVRMSRDGKKCVIGAPGLDGSPAVLNAGAIYCARYTTSWALDPIIYRPGSRASNDFFGSRLSLSKDGNTLLTTMNPNFSLLKINNTAGTTWTLANTWPLNSIPGNSLTITTAISGDKSRIAAGVSYDNNTTPGFRGALFLFPY